MGNRSIFYSRPNIYCFGLKLIHGKHLSERYNYMAEKIGKNKSVLEPACGPALLEAYLQKGCTYKGFDINEQFVENARKRGLDVNIGNAMDSSAYMKSDVVILCDALHHIGLKNEKSFLRKAANAAKKMLIICEPFQGSEGGILRKIGNMPVISRILVNYLEQDGNNQVKLESFRTQTELEMLMKNGFGVISNKTKKEIKAIGSDLIVIYYK